MEYSIGEDHEWRNEADTGCESYVDMKRSAVETWSLQWLDSRWLEETRKD